jgi:hypothetical protein
MKKKTLLYLLLLSASQLTAQTIPLAPANLKAVNTIFQETTYKGKNAVRVTGKPGTGALEQLVIVSNTDFTNGTIEVELSGDRQPGSDINNRGFVGIAFRVQGTDAQPRYECFYLRPTNGRAEDQLRRNHSAQYISHPEFTWDKLRRENPGVYESYTDLVAGEWTKIKIVVKDRYARLYVNGADQPCLIVNDLKQEISGGPVALWIDIGTEAYFRELKISK